MSVSTKAEFISTVESSIRNLQDVISTKTLAAIYSPSIARSCEIMADVMILHEEMMIQRKTLEYVKEHG
jgi:hypothetical protein